MTKLEKIGADLKRATAKQAEWNQKVKDLENRYREEENNMIHTMVHAANLSPEQLAQIIAMASQGNVGAYPEGMGSDDEDHDQNDEENDQNNEEDD